MLQGWVARVQGGARGREWRPAPERRTAASSAAEEGARRPRAPQERHLPGHCSGPSKRAWNASKPPTRFFGREACFEGQRESFAPSGLVTALRGKGGRKGSSRRRTLGEPLGFAGPPAAAVACAAVAGLRRKSLRFQVFPEPLASSLGKPKISAPYSPPSGHLRLSPAAACGTLLAALVASVTSFALNDRLLGHE